MIMVITVTLLAAYALTTLVIYRQNVGLMERETRQEADYIVKAIEISGTDYLKQMDEVEKNTRITLIDPAGAPMGYLTQKGFFDTIPKAIDEAARIDGATNFQVFTRINLPLSKPIIVYTALPSFTWPWSDFILPKLLLKEKDLYTVAVGLMSLDETEFARFAAGSVFIAVPIVILYFFLVKNMVNGMAQGAVKG